MRSKLLSEGASCVISSSRSGLRSGFRCRRDPSRAKSCPRASRSSPANRRPGRDHRATARRSGRHWLADTTLSSLLAHGLCDARWIAGDSIVGVSCVRASGSSSRVGSSSEPRLRLIEQEIQVRRRSRLLRQCLVLAAGELEVQAGRADRLPARRTGRRRRGFRRLRDSRRPGRHVRPPRP